QIRTDVEVALLLHRSMNRLDLRIRNAQRHSRADGDEFRVCNHDRLGISSNGIDVDTNRLALGAAGLQRGSVSSENAAFVGREVEPRYVSQRADCPASYGNAFHA